MRVIQEALSNRCWARGLDGRVREREECDEVTILAGDIRNRGAGYDPSNSDAAL